MDTQNHSPTPSPSTQPATTKISVSKKSAQPANATPPGRSGANDNPDEFSEFADKRRRRHRKRHPDNPEDQPGHVEQNQDPAAVRAAQHADDNDEQREAWAKDDPRYAGGGTHNTREEPADANYPAS